MVGKPVFFPRSLEVAQAEIQQIIAKAPSERSRWTLSLLRDNISWFKARSLSCVWKTMTTLGLVYKRGREATHSPDPDYDLKLAYIVAAQQQVLAAPEQVVLLYQDELTYYRRPSLARAYATVASKEPKVLLGYTTNKKRRIAGSLNWFTGQFHAQQRHRFGVEQLQRYYRYLETLYPDARTIYLVQDNWQVHRHPSLWTYFQRSRIVPLFLPTYAPWTNPTEKVWRRLKQELLHLHPFGDNWQALQHHVHAWLTRWHLPSPELLHYVGLSPF